MKNENELLFEEIKKITEEVEDMEVEACDNNING